MPKSKVNDPITDQEMAFAHLVLAGGMTDRQAAETAGLNPDSAAYTKSKPRVRAYMLEHRAAVQQHRAQQEAEQLHRFHLDRQQVLFRLWEIARMAPDMTRGSISGQVKALAMIVAMENFIPDRKAAAPSKETTPPPDPPKIYQAAWLREQQAATNETQPPTAPPQQQDSPAVPQPDLPPHPAEEAPSHPAIIQPTFPNLPAQPYVSMFASVPDTRLPFSIKKNPYAPLGYQSAKRSRNIKF